MEHVIIIAAVLWSLYFLVQRFRHRKKQRGAIQKDVVVINPLGLRLASSSLQNHL